MDKAPRARFLLTSIGDAVKKFQSDTADIETICSIYCHNDGTILKELDESINQHGYSRIVPDGDTSPGSVTTSHLGSALHRKRLVWHYERDDVDGDPLPKLPAEPATGAKMETLAEHLVSNADDQANDAFEFVPGEFVRLETSIHITPNDERSPLLAGHLFVGGAPSALFVGAIAALRKLPGLWRVLKVAAVSVSIISTNHSEPTRRNSPIADITEQFEQRFQVFPANGTLMSPRTWGEPPVNANMLIEREGHPGRASCVLAAEAASTFGHPDLTTPSELDLQRLVGNTIKKTMADAIASRTYSSLIEIANKKAANQPRPPRSAACHRRRRSSPKMANHPHDHASRPDCRSTQRHSTPPSAAYPTTHSAISAPHTICRRTGPRRGA